jgi:hypothetical protein
MAKIKLVRAGFLRKSQGLALDNLSFSASATLSLSLSIPAGGSKVLVNWPSVLGQTYQLEYCTNLVDPIWTPLGIPATGTGGTITLTNSLSGAQQSFFRLRLVN